MTIHHIRLIVRVFRKFLKKETLQKYVKNQFGTELKLIFGVKTRWNSLCDMLERFLKLKDCIMKAMIDLKINLQLDIDDFTKLENLVAALKPTKTTVEVFCKQNANLIKADAALNALLDHLQNQEIDVLRSLYFNLVMKLKERRTIGTDVLNTCFLAKYIRRFTAI